MLTFVQHVLSEMFISKAGKLLHHKIYYSEIYKKAISGFI